MSCWLCPLRYAAFTATIPPCDSPKWEKFYLLSFFMSVLWIGGISYLMIDWTAMIGCIIGIDQVRSHHVCPIVVVAFLSRPSVGCGALVSPKANAVLGLRCILGGVIAGGQAPNGRDDSLSAGSLRLRFHLASIMLTIHPAKRTNPYDAQPVIALV
jgi:hypothetical protein